MLVFRSGVHTVVTEMTRPFLRAVTRPGRKKSENCKIRIFRKIFRSLTGFLLILKLSSKKDYTFFVSLASILPQLDPIAEMN